MRILAIETSCDETAIALLECSGGLGAPKFKVLQEAVASQIAIHRPFGGVVPTLAKREHEKNLPILLARIIHNSKFILQDLDLIAVTVGPGLEPALWAGIEFAKSLYRELKIGNPKLKIMGANHLEGHLYSFLLPGGQKTVSTKHEARSTKKIRTFKKLKTGNLDIVSDFGFRASDLFPAVALLVSGGHTMLLAVKNLKTWGLLGETRDDAVGEAFDKVARLLNLPYPGGPEVEKLARAAQSTVKFPRPMLKDKNYDFSFSGLKTAVLYHLRDNKDSDPAAVAKGFSNAAIEVLLHKTMRAAQETGARSVMLSGGVAANKSLRQALQKEAKRYDLRFLVSEAKYNTDNAAMIAAAAYLQSLRGKKYPLRAKGDLGV